jgi:hypothetical protein
VNTISSRDSTAIAYDKSGEGPALILVDGALSVHSSGGNPSPGITGWSAMTRHACLQHSSPESSDVCPGARALISADVC